MISVTSQLILIVLRILSSIMLLIKNLILSIKFIDFRNLVTMIHTENYQILYCTDISYNVKELKKIYIIYNLKSS